MRSVTSQHAAFKQMHQHSSGDPYQQQLAMNLEFVQEYAALARDGAVCLVYLRQGIL
jgi:hypothetical protein